MKTAIVHDYLDRFGGAEQVLLALMEMYPSASVYSFTKRLESFPGEVKERLEDQDIRTSAIGSLPFSKYYAKQLVPFTGYWFESLDLREYELIISDGTIWSKSVLTNPDQKHIFYCHTPPRFLYKYSYESAGREAFFYKPFVRILDHRLRVWDYISAQRPDIIAANSLNTQKRIKKFWNRDSEVIHPPINIFGYDPSLETDNYYLVVSRLERYKNVDKVIEVFNLLGWKLKIVGSGTYKTRLKLMAGDNIEFYESLGLEELKVLYQRAKGFIMPSSEEDFGMVMVEAMGAGTPVLALKQGGAEEIIAEKETGLFYEDNNVESLLNAVRQFNGMDFKREKIASGVKDKFAKERFIKEFKRLVENKI